MSFDIVVIDTDDEGFEHDVIPMLNGEYGEPYLNGVIEE